MRQEDEEYVALLENGLCERFLGMAAVGPGHPEAEAFIAEMTQRAEVDGFPVWGYYVPTSPGSAFLEPGVMLLRPNGDDYPWMATNGGWINTEEWQTKLLPLLEADWGEQLSAARLHARAIAKRSV
jgi:hypothetical protein